MNYFEYNALTIISYRHSRQILSVNHFYSIVLYPFAVWFRAMLRNILIISSKEIIRRLIKGKAFVIVSIYNMSSMLFLTILTAICRGLRIAKKLCPTRIRVKTMDNSTKKIVLGILSFFIPLVGLILWLVKKSSEEDVAKTCGIAALVGFIINLLIIAAV